MPRRRRCGGRPSASSTSPADSPRLPPTVRRGCSGLRGAPPGPSVPRVSPRSSRSASCVSCPPCAVEGVAEMPVYRRVPLSGHGGPDLWRFAWLTCPGTPRATLMIDDHPLRFPLVNELHARPFASLGVPGHAVCVAVKQPVDAHNRDRAADRAHLLVLLDRHGAAHPPDAPTHYGARIGRHDLRWESHTEFVTYSAFGRGVGARAFDPADAEVFPPDWLAAAPGKRIAACLIRIEPLPDDLDRVRESLDAWFVAESLACSWVLDEAAIIAGDFPIDPARLMRFAVFVRPGTGARRVGRIVQRLCEIEIYRAMSMLGLGRARELTGRLNALDPELSALVTALSQKGSGAEATLDTLLGISAELEALATRHTFRFGAT